MFGVDCLSVWQHYAMLLLVAFIHVLPFAISRAGNYNNELCGLSSLLSWEELLHIPCIMRSDDVVANYVPYILTALNS